MESIGRLIHSAESEQDYRGLQTELSRLCPFDNLILYAYEGSTSPELLGSSLPDRRLREQMKDYTDGLFLLDPFVIEAQKSEAGVFRLREIMPDDFYESEFYRYHYIHTDVHDEVRFIVPLCEDRMVHVFVEREVRSAAFNDRELALLRGFWPIIELYVRRRMARIDSQRRDDGRSRLSIDLRARIESMGSLTDRECQVVELLLRGHATKSIAQRLSIEVGTVTNHKRHIYAKLGIHSQAHLFERFLRSIGSL